MELTRTNALPQAPDDEPNDDNGREHREGTDVRRRRTRTGGRDRSVDVRRRISVRGMRGLGQTQDSQRNGDHLTDILLASLEPTLAERTDFSDEVHGNKNADTAAPVPLLPGDPVTAPAEIEAVQNIRPRTRSLTPSDRQSEKRE